MNWKNLILMILELMSLENESKAVQYEGEVFEVYLQGDGELKWL